MLQITLGKGYNRCILYTILVFAIFWNFSSSITLYPTLL